MDQPFRRLDLFSALLALLTFLPLPVTAQRVGIRGKVVNQKGEPVAGARIQIVGMEVFRDIRSLTSSRGDFFSAVPLGEYRVVCRAPGYIPAFVEGIKALGDREFVEVSFRLKPGEDRKLPFELTKQEIPKPKEALPDSCLIVGFSHQRDETEVSTELEGVLSHNVFVVGASTQTVTEYWSLSRDGSKGRRIHEQKTPIKRAFYSFPVPSGKFSLSGFIETLRPERIYEFDKFVHSCEIPTGKAVYIGSFHLGKLVPKEPVQVGMYPLRQIVGTSQVSVRFDKEAYEWMKGNLKEIDGHEIVISPSITIN